MVERFLALKLYMVPSDFQSKEISFSIKEISQSVLITGITVKTDIYINFISFRFIMKSLEAE